MKRRNFAHRPGCAVEATLDLIDGKWKGVILFHLQAGTRRSCAWDGKASSAEKPITARERRNIMRRILKIRRP